MMNKVANFVLLVEVLLHILLVISSLVLSSAGYPVNNILSSEGLRWSFLNAVSNVLHEPLFYLIGFFLSRGAFKRSGLDKALLRLCIGMRGVPLSFRQRRALWFALLLTLLFVLLLLVLVLFPQGILVSVTGRVFPSPFSVGLVPTCMVALVLVSVTYGVIGNTLRTFHEVVQSIYCGLGEYAGWILVYLLGAQSYACLMYIFPNL